ncbi:MAG: AAA family ATPase [Muribaculaceae bacterium]|nr:AAA family ATPase [Muribaculaceae bacterium]
MGKKSDNIDLDNKEFQDVWKLLRFTNQSIFLTGRAGTGKSTFLRYITRNIKKNYVVLAPTGIAAVNVGGQTIHSFFRLPLKPVLPDDPDFAVSRLRERMKYPRPLKKLLEKLDLIIIDEISMVRADTIDLIDRILRVFCHNMRVPFGGKQLLLVGDIYQLEPVVESQMKAIMRRFYPQPFFFNARAFGELGIVAIELNKVYRQNDAEFVEMLDRVRCGRPLPADMMRVNSRVRNLSVDELAKRDDADSKPVLTLAARRDTVDYINEQRLRAIDSPEYTFIGTISGDFPENSLPTSLQLTLKKGAQVLFIKNDREKRWVNGTLGRITSIDDKSLEVEVDGGERYWVEPETWSNIKYEYDEKSKKVVEKELGNFTQFPLKPAWALTIHKSQGLTFDRVNIDIGRGAFASGQSYVALSRCRSLEGMTLLSPLNERDMVVNPAIIEFARNFNDIHAIEGALAAAQADDLTAGAMAMLDRGELVDAFDRFIEASRLRDDRGNVAGLRLVRRKLHAIENQANVIESLNRQIDDYKAQLRELAREYIEMGRECADNGLNDAAVANYEKALKLDPENVETMIAMGVLYEANGEDSRALSLFRRAAETDRDNPITACRIAATYRRMGDNFNALDTLLEAVGRMPESADLHRSLAVSYRRAGETDEAARHEAIARSLSRRDKKK